MASLTNISAALQSLKTFNSIVLMYMTLSTVFIASNSKLKFSRQNICAKTFCFSYIK